MTKWCILIFLLPVWVSGLAQGQYTLTGKVSDGGDGIPAATLQLKNEKTSLTSITDTDGSFEIQKLREGSYTLSISSLGFKSITQEITIPQEKQIEITLKPDLLELEQVVVTGTRGEVPSYEAPVIVNKISSKTFAFAQAQSMAEGLHFSPGLRVENNCQNCGFTQVRMNGLDGAYSQILINNRPVFSALAGVYGLEMIPPAMIDRVEVVKGGGSALYGGNAIAGTINIITKEPVENSFQVGYNQAFTDFSTPDQSFTFNGSLVNDNLTKGISFYGFNRNRAPWDANGDGFSELTKIRNNTVGVDAFWQTQTGGKLKVNGYAINEFRRGGNDFNLAPHQSDVAEQLEHSILGGGFSFDQFTPNNNHKFSAYGSLQYTDRASYYGAGGRVLGPNDTLTETDLIAINAYGNSTDLAAMGGIKYTGILSPTATLTVGSEYIYNDVIDQMPGYNRTIDQQVTTFGQFAQVEWDPTKDLCLVLGGRLDLVSIQGRFDLEGTNYLNEAQLSPIVPRISIKYNLLKNWKLRASYAQGYRAPQAFDEDLHIETVGGAARFTLLAPDLATELSDNYTASVNYTKILDQGPQFNVVVEGFLTRLRNPFILSNQRELPNGVAVITKRNGAGAQVQGVNLEVNTAFSKSLLLQAGATLQQNLYDEEEVIWEPESELSGLSATVTKTLLRTPNAYGFFTVSYSPFAWLTFATSGTYTGPMDVPHIIDPETEYTIIERTPDFFDWNFKLTLTKEKEDHTIEVSGGVQNLLNSFQQDFDFGADRDAGYVYGPLRPRTVFFGLTYKL